ncbi:MAG TPA: hypothetical protein VM327_08095 [Candidatus Thermoplasmatota archaeon]|nr:hypothetical protein [Candidatus Thermoplasmatota archaeon]
MNDAEIASYLQSEYGLPATYAEIQAQTQTTSGIEQHAWSWGAKGSAPSQVTILADPTNQTDDSTDRFFWPHGDGMGSIDFSYTKFGPAYTDRYAYGTMQPPMLLASFPGGLFVGPTYYYPSLSGEGAVKFYKDRACEQPEP